MVQGERYLMSRGHEIRGPLLMLLGSQDPVIDPKTSRTFFERVSSEDKTLLIYPGMLHEPLNEIGREQVIADVAHWIERRF
jgi:alpha-beta hydrolase superfamily lysophospholipase